MATSVILEPTSNTTPGTFVATGGNLTNTVNDSSDATFVRKAASDATSECIWDITNPTLNTTTAIPWRIRGLARIAQGSSASTRIRLWLPADGTLPGTLFTSASTTGTVSLSGSATSTPVPSATVTGNWISIGDLCPSGDGRTLRADPAVVQIDQCESIRVGFRDSSPSATRATVYAIWTELETTTAATVTNLVIDGDTSSPYAVTASTRPLVEWTYTQADGIVQDRYEVAVFSAATTDMTDPTNRLWTSGVVSSSATSVRIDLDLVNGATYFIYVRAGFTLGAYATYWSTAAASGSTSVTITAPSVPTIVAGYDVADGHTSVTVTGAAYTLGRQVFEVQRSTDGGATWSTVRGADAVLPDVAHRALVEDYEPPRGPSAHRVNLCPNPSFESATTEWTAAAAMTATRSTVWADDGSASLLLTPTGAADDTYAVLGPDNTALQLLQPGKTYTVSATCYVPAAQTGTLNARARSIVVFWRASTGTNQSTASTAASNTAGNVQRLSVTFTVPAAGQVTSIRLMNGATNSASNLIYWDSVLIEEAATAGEYFDGSGGGTNLLTDPAFTLQSVNLLGVNEATIEGGIGSWYNSSNTAAGYPQRSTVQAFEGTASLLIRSAAAGNVVVETDPVNRVPVVANRWLTISGRVRAAATSRTVDMVVQFWDSSGAGAGQGSASATATSTGWALAQGSVLVPSNAVTATLRVRVVSAAAAGEDFYADALGIWHGVGGVWATSGADTTAVPAWQPNTATVVRDTTVSRSGGSSARVTSTGNFGNISSERFRVVAGAAYAGSAYVMAPAMESGLDAYATIQWFTVQTGGAALSETAAGPAVAIGSDSGWQRVTTSGTAPATATWAQIAIVGTRSLTVSGQSFYVDDAAVRAIANSQGTYLDPSVCRWLGAADLSPSVATPAGYATSPAAVTAYRARAYASVSGQVIGSAWSQVRPVLVQPDGLHWLKVPEDPTLNVGGVQVLADPDFEIEEQTTTLRPLGRSDAVVVAGALGGSDGTFEVYATPDTWERVRAVLTAQRVLLWQDPYGQDRYLRIVRRSWQRTGATGAAARYRATVNFVEVGAP